MADRFYCPGPWAGPTLRIEGDEAKHLARVRRVAEGDPIEVFDGLGTVADAVVARIGRDLVEATVVATRPGSRDLAGSLVLATAVPKGDRFDWLVEKATEVGVTRLVPLNTERSVVDPRSAKLDRLRRTVIEACKQSGRSRLMEIAEPVRWSAWLEAGSTASARLLADPGGASLSGLGPFSLAGSVVVAIGPEGGFTPEEIEAAVAHGYRLAGLGPTILRVETAAVVATGAIVGLSGGIDLGTGVDPGDAAPARP